MFLSFKCFFFNCKSHLLFILLLEHQHLLLNTLLKTNHSGKCLIFLWKLLYNLVTEWSLELRKGETSDCSLYLDVDVIWCSDSKLLPIKRESCSCCYYYLFSNISFVFLVLLVPLDLGTFCLIISFDRC